MKFRPLIVISLLTIISGCSIFASQPTAEKMMDYASKLKDLSQTVDGYLRFGGDATLEGPELLEAAVLNSAELEFFSDYQIFVKKQGNNAILLMCDENTALLEDVGCNANFDKHHWQASPITRCGFTLDSSKICSN